MSSETFPHEPVGGLIDGVPEHLKPQPLSAPEVGNLVANPEGLSQNPITHKVVQGTELPRLDLIDGVPDHLRPAGLTHKEMPIEKVIPKHAPIPVSSPGDPGHEQLVARWQADQDVMRAAAAAVDKRIFDQ